MKKFTIPFIVLIAFASVACGSNNSNAAIESETKAAVEITTESETPESSSVSGGNENFTIDHGSAGPFAIKAAFPGDGSYMGYDLVRKEETRAGEGGSYTVITYDCMKDGEKHIVLVPNIESDGSEGALIEELRVYSDLYKTDAGIGAGNTIEEFYFNYANAEALYSFISGAYWLDTKDISSAQFLMKEGDYSEEPGFDSDLIELDKSKFKKGAKIEYVRIY